MKIRQYLPELSKKIKVSRSFMDHSVVSNLVQLTDTIKLIPVILKPEIAR